MGKASRQPPRKTRRAAARAELLRLIGWCAVTLLVGTLVVLWLLDSDRGPNCASLSIREQVHAQLAREPEASVFELAEETHHSVAVTLDAFPVAQRTGVVGSQAEAVWPSLQAWPQAVLFLAKGGQTFKVYAPLKEFHPDPRTATWRLGGPADALQGRLQLNEIGSIYAWVAGPEHKLSPAILFLDRTGEVAFVVAPGNVFEEPLDALPHEFAATVHLMRQLEPACAPTGP